MRTTGSWPRPADLKQRSRFQESPEMTERVEYDLSEIAGLENQQIQKMSHEELEGVVSATRSMVLNTRCPNRLSHFDQSTLKRLVYLARYCCQNQRARTPFSGNESHACLNTQKK